MQVKIAMYITSNNYTTTIIYTKKILTVTRIVKNTDLEHAQNHNPDPSNISVEITNDQDLPKGR
jgi:hypothetical protein